MKKMLSLVLCLALLVCLTACGAGSGVSMKAAQAAPREEAAAMDMAAGVNSSMTGNTGSTALPENRKWIITVNMDVETEDLDTLLEDLDTRIRECEGYVEDQNLHNGSNYSTHRYRSANLTVRIPAQQVDAFTGSISGLANVTSQNLIREDITLQYSATANRVAALETEEARLLELLAEAETMADLLEIEARLTDVRYELENHASQLRLYDNQVDYATIYLTLEEVTEYTPVEPTLWERISGGFTGSLKGLSDGAVDLMVWIIVNSPYLVVYGIGFALALILSRRYRKKHPGKKLLRKKKEKEAAKA